MGRWVVGVLAGLSLAACANGDDGSWSRQEFYAYVEKDLGLTVVDEAAADRIGEMTCQAIRDGGEEGRQSFDALLSLVESGGAEDSSRLTHAVVSTYCPEFLEG